MKVSSPLFLALVVISIVLAVLNAVAQDQIDILGQDRPALMHSVPVGEQAVRLRDMEGRELEAVLVSAVGEQITLKRASDGQEFEVPIATFDSESQGLIAGWIDSDPSAVEYTIDFEVEKKQGETNKFETASRIFETEQWGYTVRLMNRSRNDLAGAELEYRLIYNDRVRIVRTTATPGDGENQQEGQSLELPTLITNEQIEFETPTIPLETYEYEPTRGEHEYARDLMVGIWIRVLKSGIVLSEFKSNETALADVSWDNESETEIKIVDRFGENFAKGTTALTD
ncbi:MAG: hypothetical protein AAF236_00825 [Verrucomicrobiota bacterium]